MKRYVPVLFIAVCLVIVCPGAWTAEADPGEIWVATVSDTINPMVSEYLGELIAQADPALVRAIIIQLDTAGGLLESTHAIVKSEMNAKVPVIVYVSPHGARAASAGMFITLAAHVAAMAPATHIGAAHPVSLGPGGISPPEQEKDLPSSTPADKSGQMSSDTMSEKILNDTLAWARSIAENRNRNMEWIIQAVTQSVSSTETEALEAGVIDLVCEDLESLIVAIQGRSVVVAGKPLVIDVSRSPIKHRPMTFRQKFLSVIINPTIAIYLLAAGLVGLYIEITHPGLIFPGVIGGISLILALFAMHTLPINYAGLFLILLSFAFFIAEVKVQSYGLLTIGGLVAFLLGASMLIDSELPGLEVSMTAILPLALSIAAIMVLLVSLIVRVHARKPMTGDHGMMDQEGLVRKNLDPVGSVFIHGEIWRARSLDGSTIAAGKKIKVTGMEGLLLLVRPVETKKEVV